MPHQTPPLAEHSILSLVQNHTLDVSVAALLWALAARRGSLIVASPPQFAGKTTLLHAVLDLQPRETRVVVARGADEDYVFLVEADPVTTTILVPEFSDHLAEYTWGDRTPPVFDAMGRGFAMGATMHAASAEEVLEQLAAPPNGVSPRQLGRIHAIVTIAVWSDGVDYVRRVHALSVVGPAVPRRGLPRCQPVAWWEQARDAWRVDRGASALAARFGLDGDPAWRGELTWRRGVLRRLLERGIVEPERVRKEAWRARPPE